MPGRGGANRGGGNRGAGWGAGGPGRSASSPGHLKREAGAQSARDDAPSRANRATADEVGGEPGGSAAPRGDGLAGLLDRLLGRR